MILHFLIRLLAFAPLLGFISMIDGNGRGTLVEFVPRTSTPTAAPPAPPPAAPPPATTVQPAPVSGNPPVGGGTPGTTTLGTLPDNGGLGSNVQMWYLFLPIVIPYAPTAQFVLATFDSTVFDDPLDPSIYVYRMENIAVNRVPTVRRVILQYRDLGPCTITAILSGSNDNGQVVSQSATKSIGNTVPTRTILTSFIDIELTAFLPQLVIHRAAGAGPLSIVSTTIIGEVEEVTL